MSYPDQQLEDRASQQTPVLIGYSGPELCKPARSLNKIPEKRGVRILSYLILNVYHAAEWEKEMEIVSLLKNTES